MKSTRQDYNRDKIVDFSLLVGQIITSVERGDQDTHAGEECLEFTTAAGDIYQMLHLQDCCECVDIEDIVGDLDDLLNTPVLFAEESNNDGTPAPDDRGNESYTWTFYRIGTIKGSVVIRWFGSSNGYYSETVDFILKG